MTVVYLVAGATRGLGLGFVRSLAARDDTHVFATARNLNSASLLDAVAQEYQNVTVLKWDAEKEEDSKTVKEAIEQKGLGLDVVIANAAFSANPSPAALVAPSDLLSHFLSNTLGPLHLFQALYPLLEKSSILATGGGVFVPISTSVSQISVPSAPSTSYGASKAALNYIAKRIAEQHERIKVLIVHPGLVKTEGSTAEVAAFGLDIDNIPGLKAQTVDEAAAKVLGIIDDRDRFESGAFLDSDRQVMTW